MRVCRSKAYLAYLSAAHLARASALARCRMNTFQTESNCFFVQFIDSHSLQSRHAKQTD